MKVCEWCKKEYDGEGERFCSRTCYLNFVSHFGYDGKQRAVCVQCGKEYRINVRSKNTTFCSSTCYHDHKRAHPEQYSTAKTIAVTCEFCGKEFEKKRSQYLKAPHHFCSRECANKAHSEAIQQNQELAKRENSNVTCQHCGKAFYVKPNRVKSTKFCCRACAYAARFGTPTSAHNPNVAGDKNPNFKGTNNRATARLNGSKYLGTKCMICGWDTVVDVHHIIPRRLGGSNEIDNLIVLCPNHHRMADLGMIGREELLNITHAAIAQLSDRLPQFGLQSPAQPESGQPSLLFDSPESANPPD